MEINDTIAAISTALGIGAISIIRVSGPQAIETVSNLSHNSKLLAAPSHTIHYGHIYEDKKIIDEVLISIMKAPKTFTCEDIVEINCHGGISTTNKVLELLLLNGIRLAEPGEFTKRAFLNGRIDLIKAEGIMSLINAKTDQARNLSIAQISGNVSNLIISLRDRILNLLANIEVNIDYPEYEDAIVITHEILKPELTEISEKLKKIIKEAENGKLIENGIKTAIIGKPNVGKSSLLNALLQEEKAIVTDIAGTTRDIVEGEISFGGVSLKIIDTAGIRETEDIVEKIGVEKSKQVLNQADLVLAIFDSSREITEEDKDILTKIKDKKHLIILNKTDLPSVFDENVLNNYHYVKCSIVNNEGIDELKETIKNMFDEGLFETEDVTYLSNARQISLAKQALKSIEDALTAINNQIPIEMVAVDIKNCFDQLGEIIGATYSDELIDKLFTQFCLGK